MLLHESLISHCPNTNPISYISLTFMFMFILKPSDTSNVRSAGTPSDIAIGIPCYSKLQRISIRVKRKIV